MTNIIYQNKQKYSECQLIAALNAAYKLGQPRVRVGGNQYERLVDLVNARTGSATEIEKAYDYLRLSFIDMKETFDSVKFALDRGMPVNIGVYTKTQGNHSVTIVDRKGTKVRIPNMAKDTDKNMWIEWADVIHLLYSKPNNFPLCGYFRMFFLDPLFQPKEKTIPLKSGKGCKK